MDPVFENPKYAVKEVGDFQALSQNLGWGITLSRIPETWKVSRGEGVTVMVVDSGHTVHPDLGDNVVFGANFINDEDKFDYTGHATHVCGTIAAQDNSSGVVGVAPECKVITVKALNKNGVSSGMSVIRALRYAVEIKPDIVNLSLGSKDHMPPEVRRLIQKLSQMNIPVVCAAGNDGDKINLSYPAGYPETIAVGAYDYKKKVADFSQGGALLDFVAPGVDILSTWTDGRYATLSGSSMSAPFVTGIIALGIAKHRKQEKETGKNDFNTVKKMKKHLIKYSTDYGVVGRDRESGYGIIDVFGFVTANALDTDETPMLANHPYKDSVWSRIKSLFI